MLRKTLTILSLIGLLLSVGLWGVTHLQQGLHWSRHNRRGFFCRSSASSKKSVFKDVILGFPIWVVCLGFLGLFVAPRDGPIRALHRRRKRKKLGLCLKCGYNLTGLTELRCPECGQEFETSCSARP